VLGTSSGQLHRWLGSLGSLESLGASRKFEPLPRVDCLRIGGPLRAYLKVEVATVGGSAFSSAGDEFATANTLARIEVAPSHVPEHVVAALRPEPKSLRSVRSAERPCAPAWRNPPTNIAEEFGPTLHGDVDAVVEAALSHASRVWRIVRRSRAAVGDHDAVPTIEPGGGVASVDLCPKSVATAESMAELLSRARWIHRSHICADEHG